MTSESQSEAGTAEGQGPVEIDEEMARHLENKREELFEKFELRDEFPPEVMEEAEARTEGVQEEIQDEVEDRVDMRRLPTWTTDPVDAIALRRDSTPVTHASAGLRPCAYDLVTSHGVTSPCAVATTGEATVFINCGMEPRPPDLAMMVMSEG
jgi:hypothetical protein